MYGDFEKVREASGTRFYRRTTSQARVRSISEVNLHHLCGWTLVFELSGKGKGNNLSGMSVHTFAECVNDVVSLPVDTCKKVHGNSSPRRTSTSISTSYGLINAPSVDNNVAP